MLHSDILSNVMTALGMIPKEKLKEIIFNLKEHDEINPANVQKITGLSGQSLQIILMLVQNPQIRNDALLALETAVTVMDHVKKNSETIDMSYTGPIQFSVKGRTTYSMLEEIIKNAKQCIIVTVYSITNDAKKIIELLEQKSDAGLEIILVVHTDDKNNNLDILSKLWTHDKKPKVYSRRPNLSKGHFKIHAKMIVSDRSDLFVTSANLTWHGTTNNFEIGLRVKGGTAKKADDLIRNLIRSEYLKKELI